ncbi:MAG TPA: hypothetical protein VG497_29550, partial [Kribbella sp.]|nr:hypothetical protein [Kribbella sp.]
LPGLVGQCEDDRAEADSVAGVDADGGGDSPVVPVDGGLGEALIALRAMIGKHRGEVVRPAQRLVQTQSVRDQVDLGRRTACRADGVSGLSDRLDVLRRIPDRVRDPLLERRRAP